MASLIFFNPSRAVAAIVITTGQARGIQFEIELDVFLVATVNNHGTSPWHLVEFCK